MGRPAAGPGEVMRLMGELVGAAGRVVGVDVGGALGSRAIAMLRGAGTARFEFVPGDALVVSQLAEGSFDLTYARSVLIHANNPAALLRRMYDWLRPGGCLVVQDFDLTGLNIDSAGKAGVEFQRVTVGVFEAAGRDPQTGQPLPAYFRAAGLGAPDGTDVSGILSPMAAAVPMMEAVYRSVLPQALKLGITTEARSDALLAELRLVAPATMPGRGGPPLTSDLSLLTLVYRPSLHHPAHPLELGDVGQGVAPGGDQVGVPARRNRAQAVLLVQQS